MKDFWNLFKIKTTVVKDLGVLGSSNIIGAVITGGFWFYLASALGPEEFGEIQYYLGIVGIAYFVSLISTENTITVTTAKKIKIHSTLFLISFISGAISFIMILVIVQRFDVGALVFAYIVNEMALSYIIGRKLYSEYSKNVLLQKILTVVFGLSFYYFFGVEGIIFGLALSYSHFIIIIYKGFKDNKINFSELKPHKDFIVSNYLANLVNGLRANLDKIIIVPLAGYAILGNYALALLAFTVLIMPSELVLKYIIPQDASGVTKTGLKKITVLFSIGIAAFGMIVLPILIEIFFPEYIESVEAIRIISISAIPTTIGYLLVSKFLSLEKSRFILFGRMISLSIFISSLFLLIPLLGISGIAISYVLSSTSQTTFFVIIYKMIIAKQ